MIAEWRRKQIEQAERWRGAILEIEKASKKAIKEQVITVPLRQQEAIKKGFKPFHKRNRLDACTLKWYYLKDNILRDLGRLGTIRRLAILVAVLLYAAPAVAEQAKLQSSPVTVIDQDAGSIVDHFFDLSLHRP